MDKIKEIVADLMECFDGTGTPNQHYVKNKVAELHDIVKNINYDTVLCGVIDESEINEATKNALENTWGVDYSDLEDLYKRGVKWAIGKMKANAS